MPRKTPSSVKPILHWAISQVRFPGGGKAELDDSHYYYTVRGTDLHSIGTLLASLTGVRNPSELAELTGLSEDKVYAFIEALMDSGVVADDAQQYRSNSLSAASYLDVCRRQFPVWKDRLFQQPLWQQLASGNAPLSVFAGWVLETYHFIEGANLRFPIGISRCQDRLTRYHLIRHYSEEYDHSEFFIKSLRALGVGSDGIRNAKPLPTTTAVQYVMREAARNDSLSYVTCSGFLESTGADRDNALQFFENLQKYYDNDSNEIVGPLIDHVSLDEEYGHGDLLETIVGNYSLITRSAAENGLGAAYRLLEALEDWSAEILVHYGRGRSRSVKGARRALSPVNVATRIPDNQKQYDRRYLIQETVEFHLTENRVAVETPEYVYQFEGDKAKDMVGLLAESGNGLIAYKELLNKSHVPSRDIDSVLAMLEEDGVILDADAAFLNIADDCRYLEALKKEFLFASNQIFSSRFWKSLFSGLAPESLVFGWGVEFFHFVESATAYMPAAIGNLEQSVHTRHLLVSHFLEEFDHAEIFLRGMEDCGFNRAEIMDAPPLASTRALIDFLNETSAGSILAYSAVFGVMQSRGRAQKRTDIHRFYNRLQELHPRARGMLDAHREHDLIDADLEHHRLICEAILESGEDCDIKDRLNAVYTVRDAGEYFRAFFDGIERYYGREGTLVPRRRVSLAFFD